MKHSYYLRSAITDPHGVLGAAGATLSEHIDEFDCIAVRGTSGMLIGPTLAYDLNKRLCVVRKRLQNSHAETLLETNMHRFDRYIIVDDLIDTGATFREMNGAILREYPGAIPTAFYLYNTDFWSESLHLHAVRPTL